MKIRSKNTARKRSEFPVKRVGLGPFLSYSLPKRGDRKAPSMVPGSNAKPA